MVIKLDVNFGGRVDNTDQESTTGSASKYNNGYAGTRRSIAIPGHTDEHDEPIGRRIKSTASGVAFNLNDLAGVCDHCQQHGRFTAPVVVAVKESTEFF